MKVRRTDSMLGWAESKSPPILNNNVLISVARIIILHFVLLSPLLSLFGECLPGNIRTYVPVLFPPPSLDPPCFFRRVPRSVGLYYHSRTPSGRGFPPSFSLGRIMVRFAVVVSPPSPLTPLSRKFAPEIDVFVRSPQEGGRGAEKEAKVLLA